MRYTDFFVPTFKEDPADAEVVSQKLMVRAGMIRKLAAGIYNYLPLGLRSIRKVENIVREEMNRAGAIELLMPFVLPSELWKESGRWDKYGKELLRFKDRADREFCIGPTHEEIITDIVRKEFRSYKRLPVNLYQIQTKFRDEIRPRFGVMRAREFIMKDAYSFDIDDEGAEKSYWAMYEAYNRIFERCGLEFRAVLADTGNIGGNFSHEFMVLAPTGEDVIMSCNKCDYAANLDLAEIDAGENKQKKNIEEKKTISEVHTPNLKTVDEVASFLKVNPNNLIKTMIVETEGRPVAALVRGDHELSLTKLKRTIGADQVELASEKTIKDVTGGPLGFSGPVEIKLKIIADRAIEKMINGVTGANKEDFHLTNVNPNRDFNVDKFADIRVASNDDPCPKCKNGVLNSSRGIEVGHVFKLGTKYSEAMNATFVDAAGRERFFIMGCYGIGIGRTVAAAIEQNYDDNGIVLPISIAPYEVVILPLNMSQMQVVNISEDIYKKLKKAGTQVVIDDREESAGIKFKDADLIGIPIQIVVGPRTIKEDSIEIKLRKGGISNKVKIEEVEREVESMLNETTNSKR
ncbi:proline--tRNA ligase [Desulfobacterota bacterium AH_259_B03_O07]|nr:proline--tRNA ligase [Desulfobacterota bacterium AH_259_B03_O07]